MNSIVLFMARSIFLCCALIVIMPGPPAAASPLTLGFVRVLPARQQPWYQMEYAPEINVDDWGAIYIASPLYNQDSDTKCWIRKLSGDGKLVTSWPIEQSDNDNSWPCIFSTAVDKHGNIYAADGGNNLVRKYSPSGKLLGTWGGFGVTPGLFYFMLAIAVDDAGNVYVTDKGTCNIQKFTSDGEVMAVWGTRGYSDGQFQNPSAIAIDRKGEYVYVLDGQLCRVQKFTLDGQFVTKWGTYGTGDGQFYDPTQLSVDWEGNVHVAEYWNRRVQKFTPDGRFILKWSEAGWAGDKIQPTAIAADNAGYIYINSPSFSKFTCDGVFVASWASNFAEYASLSNSYDMALDGEDNIYVTDSSKDCVFKYTRKGELITRWGSKGEGDGQFNGPLGIAVDKDGYVYVVDIGNNRVQKFSSDGHFIMKWGSRGDGEGQFFRPAEIAVDRTGHVYVTDDDYLNRIHKFDRNGRFLGSWTMNGAAEGVLYWPQIADIAVDGNGDVYIAESHYGFIEKYSPEGRFLSRWDYKDQARDEGTLSWVGSISFDRDGSLLAMTGHDIMKFTPDGKLIGKWAEPGREAGQIFGDEPLAVGKDGLVYVLQEDRIQVFKELPAPFMDKAVILAGRGPSRDRPIWDQTRMNANFVHRTLVYQGFPRKSIFYLSTDRKVDLDGNNESDDVSAPATLKKLHYTLTRWAAGARDVVIYLAGSGDAEGLAITAGEKLSADDLLAWLDELQARITGRIVLVVDASCSGRFLEKLSSGTSDKRIVISSTTGDEKAWLVHQGAVSFSSYFWTRIFNGDDLGAAFSHAREAMELGSFGAQHPQLEAGGQAPANDPSDLEAAGAIHIGNGEPQKEKIPEIGSASVESLPDATHPRRKVVRIAANGVTATDYINRVWAMIVPPGTTPGSGAGSVHTLRSVDLEDKGQGSYEVSRSGMSTVGTYHIALYAMDRYGNTSLPVLTTYTVESQ